MNILPCGFRVVIVLCLAGCSGAPRLESTSTSAGLDVDAETGAPPGSSDDGVEPTSATESSAPTISDGSGSSGDTTDAGGSTGPGASSNDAGTTSAGSGSDDASTGLDPNGDDDGDGIPNGDDPFPDDAELPGVAQANLVYAHTAGTLFTMDVSPPYAIAEVGMFTFPDGGAGSMTDIAIDRFGVLYGITFDDLHVCDPATAVCHWLAALPDSSNGSTFVPPGTVDDDDDALIGIAISGSWRHMELAGAMVNQSLLGSYGVGYSSSGDAFSIEDVGTFASVDMAGDASDVIVEVDPTDGTVLQQIGVVTGYTTIYGLAGWQGAIFAFDETGDVLLVDPTDGSWELVADTPHAWWGAAVSTQLPS